MDVLVVDLTHGGITLAKELKKYFDNVFVWDIYNTVPKEKKKFLSKYFKFVDAVPKRKNIKIIAPVHCPLNITPDFTHHEAVNFILQDWKNKRDIPIIEVTGVKGKTSVVWMLKEILSHKNPLILSSIGIFLKDKVLKKDVSITPANIIKAIKLGKDKFGVCIFEVSLGGTGLADVGVLTNIVEDYPIAGGKRKASEAKKQIFRSKITCCDYKTLKKFYKEYIGEANTFSINYHDDVNVWTSSIKYDFEKTSFKVNVDGLKTLKGEFCGNIRIETFAPTSHYLLNVLAAISAALSLGVKTKYIKKGLYNFRGLKGRSSIKRKNGCRIIEEINPGINTKTIENSLEIAKNLKNSVVIIGGQYGATCEELNEERVAKIIDNNRDVNVALVDEVGKSLLKKIKRKVEYADNPNKLLKSFIERGFKNIVFVYRSKYSDLSKR